MGFPISCTIDFPAGISSRGMPIFNGILCRQSEKCKEARLQKIKAPLAIKLSFILSAYLNFHAGFRVVELKC